MTNSPNTTIRGDCRSSSRRNFLKSAGLLGLTTPVAVAASKSAPPNHANWWLGNNRLRLQAVGAPDPDFVLPHLGPMPPGECRIQMPWRKTDLMRLEIDIFPAVDVRVPLSYATIEITGVSFGEGPVIYPGPGVKPCVAMVGAVVAHDVVPDAFGNFVGAPFTLSTAYALDADGNALFTLLSLAVAGSHTTVIPTATGVLLRR